MKALRRKLLAALPLARLIYWVIRLLYMTMRVKVIDGNNFNDLVQSRQGVIGIFWHARLLFAPFLYHGQSMNVLIGTHRDGQLIADVMECFNFGLVRGSSSKGGDRALRDMVRLLKKGHDISITPDGPRGPAEVAKTGIAQVARITGKAVVPVAYSASRCIRGTSWDRFIIPLPFSRVVFVLGEPLRYQDGEDMEAFRCRIEDALKGVTLRADDYFREK
jgi:lysophospholipid acyltransferase (LPLAT)-like uncharacterized protein